MTQNWLRIFTVAALLASVGFLFGGGLMGIIVAAQAFLIAVVCIIGTRVITVLEEIRGPKAKEGPEKACANRQQKRDNNGP